MDYLLIISVFILFAGLTAFCNSVLSTISFEELNNKAEDISASPILKKIKIKYDEIIHSLGIWESVFFFLAALGTGILITNKSILNSDLLMYQILIIIPIAVLSVLVRTILYAVGRRYYNILFDPICFIAYASTVILKPMTGIIFLIDRIIGGARIEDDSREELSAIVETAHEEGTLDADEYRIFKNVLEFSNVHVSDVMTPRTVLFSLKAEKTVNEVINHPGLLMYSRFPIWDGESLDDGAIGYVLTKDILQAALHKKGDKKLRDFSREVYFIPENAELDMALDKFLQRRQHLFLVVDEYGGIEGLLTMEDVLETILGAEIVDEADKIVDLRELAKKRRDLRINHIQSKE